MMIGHIDVLASITDSGISGQVGRAIVVRAQGRADIRSSAGLVITPSLPIKVASSGVTVTRL